MFRRATSVPTHIMKTFWEHIEILCHIVIIRKVKDVYMVDKIKDIFHCFNPNFYRYKEIVRDNDTLLLCYIKHVAQSFECSAEHILRKTILHFHIAYTQTVCSGKTI